MWTVYCLVYHVYMMTTIDVADDLAWWTIILMRAILENKASLSRDSFHLLFFC